MAKPSRPSGPAPDRATLHEAALRHLARFATTEAGLVRVLDRKVQRWARLVESEGGTAVTAPSRDAVRQVARALVQSAVIDDAAFAAARAARLLRSGRSRRATAAHLAAKGVGADAAGAALPPPETELSASLVFARKRRIGPFRAEAAEDVAPESRLRDLAAFARAGFSRDIAERALALDGAEAAELVAALKRGG